MPSLDKDHFAEAMRFPRGFRSRGITNGADARRAANNLYGRPHARRVHQHGSRLRVRMVAHACPRPQNLLHPRLRLAPKFLGFARFQRFGLGPRSRLRRTFDRPGLRTGGSASMGPTNFACRLLQLKTRRTSTIRERWSLLGDEGRNPLHLLCSVESFSRLSMRKEPTGRRPRTLKTLPRRRFFP